MLKPHNIPRMARSEILARAEAKQTIVLDFLASGEVWTTSPILQELLGLSARRVHSLAQRMERDGLLKSAKIEGFGRLENAFGITSTGIAFAKDAAPDCPRFESLPSPPFMAHHLDTQRARLQAEAAGWTWEPGKLLYNKGWHKVPDALATSPGGERVAVEIERTIKTPLRYQQIIPQALRDVKAERYSRIVYISPQGRADAVSRALHRVTVVKVAGDSVKLTDAHWARFSFSNLADWPEPGAQK
ncbi:conserved protein of unknown function (plasmid) [Thiomonas sp. Bio17B3]|nr:conserved protein of unknown function [Thiomonas sp. Bio17B3]VDY09965.1 conserved protein of unknown function [Thiomonas sp. Sup16B3]VDY11208.1 conserved protein of unknown function [Thiomonas sp. Sup16B3]VDY11253.1 conserved protein of unknown function [Thiomonas sp. Bio17B3]VDY15014.1 putative mobC [Thiomonas sp. OC7]